VVAADSAAADSVVLAAVVAADSAAAVHLGAGSYLLIFIDNLSEDHYVKTI
jgi:hypothetical protein